MKEPKSRTRLHDAVVRRLEGPVAAIELATQGEDVSEIEQVRRVLALAGGMTEGASEPREQRFRSPKRDRGLERARLRAVVDALIPSTERLRQVLFQSATAPFRSWPQAVAWIESQRITTADARAAEKSAEPLYEAMYAAIERYCAANPFAEMSETALVADCYFSYVDGNGAPAMTPTHVGSPLHRLARYGHVCARVSRLEESDLHRFVLTGERPRALRSLRVSRATRNAMALYPNHPSLVSRFVTIEIDERDVTHQTFAEAFKRTREFLGIGKRKKPARDDVATQLRAIVKRCGGPSAAAWTQVCAEIPRFKHKTPDAARKAYQRLASQRGRR